MEVRIIHNLHKISQMHLRHQVYSNEPIKHPKKKENWKLQNKKNKHNLDKQIWQINILNL